MALIRPSQIKHCVYGWWQGTLKIQECMEVLFRILHLDSSIYLLQQHELDHILCLGEVPTGWSCSRHFLSQGSVNQPAIPTCCGPCHNGEGHFVTFYMCVDYLSILDPPSDGMPPPPRIQYKLHRALRKSFTSRNIPIPALPPYRHLPRIAIQPDAPLSLWSCGTFEMATTSHLLLGGCAPHSLPVN
jgi:hypothetical protein